MDFFVSIMENATVVWAPEFTVGGLTLTFLALKIPSKRALR